MPLDFDPTRPIYLQIIEAVKKRAVQGVYRAGDSLPSVREMATEMGVNPNTMSRAYMELEREGFITTRRGQGSSITKSAKRIDNERRALARAAREQLRGGDARFGPLTRADRRIDARNLRGGDAMIEVRNLWKRYGRRDGPGRNFPGRGQGPGHGHSRRERERQEHPLQNSRRGRPRQRRQREHCGNPGRSPDPPHHILPSRGQSVLRMDARRGAARVPGGLLSRGGTWPSPASFSA